MYTPNVCCRYEIVLLTCVDFFAVLVLSWNSNPQNTTLLVVVFAHVCFSKILGFLFFHSVSGSLVR